MSQDDYSDVSQLEPGDIGTRAEHIEFCKTRALEYADMGDLTNMLASLTSDLNKHSKTRGHASAELGMRLAMAGFMSTPAQMRTFIEGIN